MPRKPRSAHRPHNHNKPNLNNNNYPPISGMRNSVNSNKNSNLLKILAIIAFVIFIVGFQLETPTRIIASTPGSYIFLFSYKPECIGHRLSFPSDEVVQSITRKESRPLWLDIFQNGSLPFRNINPLTIGRHIFDKVVDIVEEDRLIMEITQNAYQNPSLLTVSVCNAEEVQNTFQANDDDDNFIMENFLADVESIDRNLLSLMQFHSNESITQGEITVAKFHSLSRSLFTVYLGGGAKPSKVSRKDYFDLPFNFFNNAEHYRRFVLKYGTHLRIKADIGGDYFKVMTFHESPSELLVRSTGSKFKAIHQGYAPREDGYHYRYTIIATGGYTLNQFLLVDHNSWLSTMETNPVPLNAEYLPINDFIDKPSSLRHYNFRLMTEYEARFHSLATILGEMQKKWEETHTSHELIAFISSAISNELQRICPSKTFFNYIRNEVEEEDNPTLVRFGITLSMPKNYNYNMGRYEIQAYYLLLINGVCLNLDFYVGTLNYEEVEIRKPIHIPCFRFYYGENCEMEFNEVFSENDVKKYISITKSISYCPPIEN